MVISLYLQRLPEGLVSIHPRDHHMAILDQGALPRSQASSMTSMSEHSELSSESSLSAPDSTEPSEPSLSERGSSSWAEQRGLTGRIYGGSGGLEYGNIMEYL